MHVHGLSAKVRLMIGFGLCAVIARPSVAVAGPLYERALVAYERVEYVEAIRLLERALADEALGPAELERGYFLLGSALVGAGETNRAERMFRTLLAIRPDYQPERDAPPKVTETVRRAQTNNPASPPKIVHDPLQHLTKSDEIEVEADMSAAAAIEPAIEYGIGDQRTERSGRTVMRCIATRCQSRLPKTTTWYRLGFVTAEGAFVLTTSDFRITVAGLAATKAPKTAKAPTRAPMPTPTPTPVDGKKSPIYKRWWPWTILGVVVAGGVVGATLGVLSYRADHAVTFTVGTP